MGMLILLLCSLPPLAVLAVAAIHGVRTRDLGIISTLGVSVMILTVALLLPLIDRPGQGLSFRFTFPEAGSIGATGPDDGLIRLTRRWGGNEAAWNPAQGKAE